MQLHFVCTSRCCFKVPLMIGRTKYSTADYFHILAYFLTMQLSCNPHLSTDELPDYIQLLDLLY